jgi:hypothetical protein
VGGYFHLLLALASAAFAPLKQGNSPNLILVANLVSLVTIPEILADPNEEFGLARAPGEFATSIFCGQEPVS